MPLFAERYPQLFEPHDCTRSFVLTLNDIIHPEVRKLYPGADVPEFDFGIRDDDRLVMGYRSPRKLCSSRRDCSSEPPTTIASGSRSSSLRA